MSSPLVYISAWSIPKWDCQWGRASPYSACLAREKAWWADLLNMSPAQIKYESSLGLISLKLDIGPVL